jgi:hypothetical protein
MRSASSLLGRSALAALALHCSSQRFARFHFRDFFICAPRCDLMSHQHCKNFILFDEFYGI